MLKKYKGDFGRQIEAATAITTTLKHSSQDKVIRIPSTTGVPHLNHRRSSNDYFVNSPKNGTLPVPL